MEGGDVPRTCSSDLTACPFYLHPPIPARQKFSGLLLLIASPHSLLPRQALRPVTGVKVGSLLKPQGFCASGPSPPSPSVTRHQAVLTGTPSCPKHQPQSCSPQAFSRTPEAKKGLPSAVVQELKGSCSAPPFLGKLRALEPQHTPYPRPPLPHPGASLGWGLFGQIHVSSLLERRTLVLSQRGGVCKIVSVRAAKLLRKDRGQGQGQGETGTHREER